MVGGVFAFTGCRKCKNDLAQGAFAASLNARDELALADSAFAGKSKDAAKHKVPAAIAAGALHGKQVLVALNEHKDAVVAGRVGTVIAQIACAAPKAQTFRALLYAVTDCIDEVCKSGTIAAGYGKQMVYEPLCLAWADAGEALKYAREFVDFIHT